MTLKANLSQQFKEYSALKIDNEIVKDVKVNDGNVWIQLAPGNKEATIVVKISNKESRSYR